MYFGEPRISHFGKGGGARFDETDRMVVGPAVGFEVGLCARKVAERCVVQDGASA